ncbi:hypothetical protein PVK73_20385 [Bacillus thuringiensis]
MNLENVEQYVQNTAKLIWNTWEHIDQIWPGTGKNFGKFNRDVLMTDMNHCWIVKTNKQIEQKPMKEMPQHIQDQLQTGNLFGEIDYDGKMINYLTVTEGLLNYKSGPDFGYRMLTHEFFHMYQGENWKVLDGMGWESPLYSNFLSPRQARLEIIKALQQALEYPNEKRKHLEAAAWWYQKYTTENPKEYKSILGRDQVEGTALYFDTIGNAYGHLGMQTPKKEIHNWMINKYKQTYQRSLLEYRAMPDDESYDIQSRASLLLDILQEHPNWKQEVAEAKIPLDILLKHYSPVQQQPSPELKQLLETSYNDKIKPGMEKLIDSLHKKDSIFLVTNGTIFPTYLIGMFRTNEFKNLTFVPYLDSYISSNQGNIHLKGGSYILGSLDEPFLNPDLTKIIPLPKNIIVDKENDTLQAISETIELNVKYDAKYVGKDGKTYYVVDVNK